MVKREDPRKKRILIYILTLIFSTAFILVARQIAMEGYPQSKQELSPSCQARVLSVISSEEFDGGSQSFLECKMLSGPDKGRQVTVRQAVYEVYYNLQKMAEPGDKILVYEDTYYEGSDWLMLEYVRSDGVVWLAMGFAVAVLIFGRWKGLNTLISLAFTCLAVFAVFIPAVLSGQNIYLWSTIVCLYMIIMTMLFINGASKKSFAAGFGCFAGVLVAGLLSALMNRLLNMTGMVSDETLYLALLDSAKAIDLRAILFASVIIGATGAIMDVAMDIASSLNEIRLTAPDIPARQLIGSGFNIGRDLLGTIANTLVLAYIGGSLCTTLLLAAYNMSMVELFNRELIIAELLQALVGSIGILLAIPLTSLVCSILYPRRSA